MAQTIKGAQLRDDSIPASKLVATYETTLFLKDGSRALTGNLNAGSNKITSLADPTVAQDAATKAYVDSVASPNAYPTSGNKKMTASVTSGANQLACATAIAATPAGDGYVQVSVNGVLYDVGSGVKTSDFYFSADSGTTAKTIANIASGDSLYTGSGLAFNLDALDVIGFFYEV